MDAPAPRTTRHIGAVAELTGLSLHTLRHYDEVGLLTPSARSDGGFRLYTDTDVDRLLLIRRMKPLGFTLDEMRDVLDVADRIAERSTQHTVAEVHAGGHADGHDDAALRERLAAHVGAARSRRDELARRLAMADEFIALLTAL